MNPLAIKSMHNRYKRDLKRASKTSSKPISGVVVKPVAESRSKSLKSGLTRLFMSLFVSFLFLVTSAGIIQGLFYIFY